MQITTRNDDDEATAWHEEDLARDDADDRRLPSIRFLAGMAALGVVLALGWRYSGAEDWRAGVLRLAAASQTATEPGPQVRESELVRITRELDALKKIVGELAGTNQQMAAVIAALQAGQQELRQRPSGLPLTSWHSDPAAMKYRIVAQKRSDTGSIAPRVPARARSTPKPSEHAPLQLTAPRP